MDPNKLTDLLEHITLLKTDLEGMDTHDAMSLEMYWSNPYLLNHLRAMQKSVYIQVRKGLTNPPESAILVDPQGGNGNDQTEA